MVDALIVVLAISCSLVGAYLWRQRRRKHQELLSHSITPRALHDLMETRERPTVLDLRVPLDFLAYTEMIPGARRIAPHEIIANPDMINRDEDYVLYCTCPGEGSSETVLDAALKLGFLRVKMLAGGIEAWKEMGYPTEPYKESFHLDVA